MSFVTSIDRETARRHVAGSDVALHCHYYNSNLQRAIESARDVDGRAIWQQSAEVAWADVLERALAGVSDAGERWRRALDLYAYLGFGRIQPEIPDGEVVATASHFVEGWASRAPDRREPVCSFAAGFLAAALEAALGRSAEVVEVSCLISGAPACRFRLAPRQRPGIARLSRAARVRPGGPLPELASNPRIDRAAILDAVWEMPLAGNADGLIPAFNVMIASMPVDFYNLVSFRFMAEMAAAGVGTAGRRLLQHVAETCAINTFRGILASPEWEMLVAPMCQEPRDVLFGAVAIGNALGWGNWHILFVEAGRSLRMVSSDGYEATGYLELFGPAPTPSCVMLAGVSCGLMELVYGAGSVRDRVGQFRGGEHACRAHAGPICAFDAEEAR